MMAKASDSHTLGQLWQAFIRQEKGQTGSKARWLIPVALYGLGSLYLAFAGPTRVESGKQAKSAPHHQLHIQGHLSTANGVDKAALRFYINLPEIPLDVYFSGPQVSWSGDGSFVLDQPIMVTQVPSRMALEVDGPGLTPRNFKNLSLQVQPDGVNLHCSIPEFSLTRGAPRARVKPSAPRLPQSVYKPVEPQDSNQSHGSGARTP